MSRQISDAIEKAMNSDQTVLNPDQTATKQFDRDWSGSPVIVLTILSQCFTALLQPIRCLQTFGDRYTGAASSQFRNVLMNASGTLQFTSHIYTKSRLQITNFDGLKPALVKFGSFFTYKVRWGWILERSTGNVYILYLIFYPIHLTAAGNKSILWTFPIHAFFLY